VLSALYNIESESSDLQTSLAIYEVRFPYDDSQFLVESYFDPGSKKDDSWLTAAIIPDEEFGRVELLVTGRWTDVLIQQIGCEAKIHTTGGGYRTELLASDIFYPNLPTLDLVPSNSYGLFVSDMFRQKLEQSRLTGFEFHLLPIEPDPFAKSVPTIPFMEVTGQIVEAPYRVVGVPNACPNCGYGPIVCTGCSHIDEICPKCQKQAVRPPGRNLFPESRPLLRAPVPKAGRPLLGRTWNGEDFIRTITDVSEFSFTERYYITRRALDWLQRVHARPYYARPALVILDGMSDEQLGWIERAKRLAPGVRP
jgi:hypothetical protein